MGGAYERVTDQTGTQHRYFIRAGGQVIAVHKVQEAAAASSLAPFAPSGVADRGATEEGGSSSSAPLVKGAVGPSPTGGFSSLALADPDGDGIWTEYLHRDHQGSIVAITSESGELLARFSYDAWGQRRSAVDLTATGTLSSNPFTSRGYTGHEHLDHVGLIHMNGRVYDPAIGRFLSADPFMQFPDSTQGLNRYSYVGNNPLSYTDPSGHFIIAALTAIAATYAESWIVAAVIGAVAGYLTTGTLEGALLGAAAAGIGFGINVAGFGFATQTLLHGVTQATIADIGGGNFADAFRSAVAGSLAQMLPLPKGPMGTVVAAMIGGTVSVIGGGKFSNGAITAAFTYALGKKAPRTAEAKSRDGGPAIPANLTDEQRAALDKAIASVNEELNQRHGTFDGTEEAAKFLHNRLGPLSREYGVEIGANIFNGSIPNTVVVFGVTTQYYTNQVTLSGRSGWTISASFHTHGSSEYSLLFSSFSDMDIRSITHSAYLSAPNGNLYHFNYSAFKASGMSDTITNRRLFIGGAQ